MKLNLKGKRIIITGASKGLGVVCAQALAQQGARLVLMARSQDKLQQAKKAFRGAKQHLAISVDLTDMKALQTAVNEAKSHLKTIDAVLHVVGGGLGLKDPLLSYEELLQLFTLNLGVAAQINRIVVPDMIKRKSGNLVHVCSIASAEATGSVGYNTVKAALAAYVRSLGREIANSGVIATGILPGGFYAPENSWVRLEKRDPKAVESFIKERLPRKFLGKAEEVVPMVLFLCSHLASMMSGCLVPVDAGEGKAYLAHV